MRGLKCSTANLNKKNAKVAPHVGAWIEIYALKCQHDGVTVAPHVGAWIEILMEVISRFPYDVSHPTWVRGLKSA